MRVLTFFVSLLSSEKVGVQSCDNCNISPSENKDILCSNSCSVCGKQFKFRSILRRHMMRHSHSRKKPKEKELKCSLCNKTFKFQSLLDRHIIVHSSKNDTDILQPDDTQDFICSICEVKFHSLDQLNQHKKFHTETEKLNASNAVYKISGKQFQFSDSNTNDIEPCIQKLDEETALSGNDRFSCQVCQKKFKFESKLKLHMVKHEEICKVCDEEFKLHSDLIQHMVTHSEKNKEKLRRYSCSKCEKKFKFKCLLEAHMLTHTGEKPYMCTICGMQFAKKHTLRCSRENSHQ